MQYKLQTAFIDNSNQTTLNAAEQAVAKQLFDRRVRAGAAVACWRLVDRHSCSSGSKFGTDDLDGYLGSAAAGAAQMAAAESGRLPASAQQRKR